MSAVFLDTVGLLALWNRTDQWRPVALSAFNSILANRRSYVTTEAVLLECGNALSRTAFRQKVTETREELLANNGLVVVTDKDWADAWSEYERGRPGDAGIVDCISFTVMRRLGLTEAFTNDQHFAAAGFTTLF